MTLAIVESDLRLASREATHRFLNTLAALHGLLRSDFGGFNDPAVRDAVGVFSSRIQAFASVHRTLGEGSDDEAWIDAPAYFARLCQELCAAHLAPRGLYCDFRSDPGTLPREVCQKLGLIVVELVTNAAKHAFAGRPGGRVRISLRRAEGAWICQVADNGSGLRGGGGSGGGGDGMKLVHGLARALGGELRITSDPGGVTAILRLPDLGPAASPASYGLLDEG
jgi:two-component sensor histidine kinase